MSRTTRRAGDRHGHRRARPGGHWSGGAAAQDQTLRVAMGSPGEAAIAVWDDIRPSTRPPIPAGRSR